MFHYVYTRQQAIADGILISISERLVFTANLFKDSYEDAERRNNLIAKGLRMLAVPDAEDSPAMKLRVIEEGRIWVIQDGDGICFLKPEDY